MALMTCPECGKDISTEAAKCPNCGKRLRRSGMAKAGIGCLVLVGLFVVISIAGEVRRIQHQEDPTSALANTKIEKLSFEMGGFGSIPLLDFTIRNTGDHGVKDVKIRCYTKASSGTLLGQVEKTVYDVVPKHSVRDFTKINMGFANSQTDHLSCEVRDVTAVP